MSGSPTVQPSPQRSHRPHHHAAAHDASRHEPVTKPEATSTANPGVQQAANTLSQTLGAQGLLQDTTRSASLLMKNASAGAQGVRAAADFFNGDWTTVDRFVQGASTRAHDASLKISPRIASAVDHQLTPALGGVGKLFCTFTRWASWLSLPFVAADVRSAVVTKDSAKKNAAIANAFLSVTGTAAGIAAGLLNASSACLPLLLVSVLSGGFQLFDNFVTKGRGTAWLGDHLVRPVRQKLSA